MTESIKKYMLLGVLIACLGLVLYAMPERPVGVEQPQSMQISSNLQNT